ncbi:hypothetical protein JMK45_004505 [Salmonella enterica]|nr:hypothetical protein [Salmonella enterica]EAX6230870.1 hypothetical protein [Salmonella enterica]ECH4803828.1 hypothetical protein [Salmonella enterica]EGL1720326.1 hypothetical protein [Salmonella enterica]EHE6188409.1 hypothetical protein [Salmonella enterica]
MDTGLCSRELLSYPAPTGSITDGKISQQLSNFAPPSSPDLQQPQGAGTSVTPSRGVTHTRKPRIMLSETGFDEVTDE